MITLFRWFLMKKKEIKFKLSLYTFLEDEMVYIEDHKEEVKAKFIHELVSIIHNNNTAI